MAYCAVAPVFGGSASRPKKAQMAESRTEPCATHTRPQSGCLAAIQSPTFPPMYTPTIRNARAVPKTTLAVPTEKPL
eukprot:1865748-Prymnesium_polylepis.1